MADNSPGSSSSSPPGTPILQRMVGGFNAGTIAVQQQIITVLSTRATRLMEGTDHHILYVLRI
jgi:hypothetical protein